MDNKYHKSKIYSIRNTFNSEIYIGSTSSDLCKRMVKHRCMAKQKPEASTFHTYMNENGIDNFYIELEEEYSCENVEQLRKREGEIIREKGTLNKQIAGRRENMKRNTRKIIRIKSIREGMKREKKTQKKQKRNTSDMERCIERGTQKE